MSRRDYRCPLTARPLRRSHLSWRPGILRMKQHFSCLAALVFIFQVTIAQQMEWPAYGGDPGGKRFLSSRQINTTNVNRLQVAWTFRTKELDEYKDNRAADDAAFEATPLMVD